jgi:hypothetical protein
MPGEYNAKLLPDTLMLSLIKEDIQVASYYGVVE